MPLPRDVVYLTDEQIEQIADRVVAKLKDVMDAHDAPEPNLDEIPEQAES